MPNSLFSRFKSRSKSRNRNKSEKVASNLAVDEIEQSNGANVNSSEINSEVPKSPGAKISDSHSLRNKSQKSSKACQHENLDLTMTYASNALTDSSFNACQICLQASLGNSTVDPFFTSATEGLDTTDTNKVKELAKSVDILDGRMSLQKAVTAMHSAAVNGDRSQLGKLLLTSAKDIDSGDQFGRTPLIFCVLADRVECAEVLLKAGCKVDKKDETGRTALHWAAHKGHYKCLKLLLGKGANWKEKDKEGETALHLSTRHKSSKCLSLVKQHLAPGEVDDQDNNKRTALHWAASYGNLEHMRLLIKQDSNSGIPDSEGKTPLHWAASSHDENAASCVKLLLETTPSVMNWQDYEGRTPLHLAVEIGNDAVVLLLTSYPSCNVSALDNMFRTPLHWAAALGHSMIAKMLLEAKADFSSADSNGATALHYAAQNNHAKTVEVFLTRAAITDEPDLEGRTALMWAASKAADEVIATWVRHNPDLQQTDKNGGTALHAAALSGHASTVKLLLEHGSDIDCQDLLMHTPLFRACEMGHPDVVQALYEGGAQVEVIDQDGRSPLHWAALGGHAYICQSLIKYGVDPNVRDFSGRTPLQCAAYGGYVNCMSVLIENKSNTNTQDKEGMSALHWACSRGHLDAVKLLIEYGAFPNHMESTEDRYTPLDYALMGEHHDVAQFIIDQGGLSITGIQDIAACKVQSAFRGFRVRKGFLERKELMVRHEQLRKDAARKRAGEEYKKKEDVRNKKEVEERYKQQVTDMLDGTDSKSSSKKKKKDELSEEERILREAKHKQAIVAAERNRVYFFRQRNNAAVTIQKAWKMFKFRTQGLMKNARDAIKLKRLDAGELEWKKQIAACTIQLAWRKYFRRKLLKALNKTNNAVMHMWDPEMLAFRQRSLVEQVYNEQLYAPHWHPTLVAIVRPYWTKYMPSSAALSFNFAIDQYSQQRDYIEQLGLEIDDDLANLRMKDRSDVNPVHYSYNMN